MKPLIFAMVSGYSPSHSFYSATLVSLLFLKHTGCSAVSGPLYLIFLLLETFFPIFSLLFPHFLPVFVQSHLNGSFLVQLISNCTSHPPTMIYPNLPSFIFLHSTCYLTYYIYLLILFVSYLFPPPLKWTGIFTYLLTADSSTWHTEDRISAE